MAESPSSALPGGVEWLPALGGAHLLRAELGRGDPPALILQSPLGAEHRVEPGPEARFSRSTDYLVPTSLRWSTAHLLWPDGTRTILPPPPGERGELIALPTRRPEPTAPTPDAVPARGRLTPASTLGNRPRGAPPPPDGLAGGVLASGAPAPDALARGGLSSPAPSAYAPGRGRLAPSAPPDHPRGAVAPPAPASEDAPGRLAPPAPASATDDRPRIAAPPPEGLARPHGAASPSPPATAADDYPRIAAPPPEGLAHPHGAVSPSAPASAADDHPRAAAPPAAPPEGLARGGLPRVAPLHWTAPADAGPLDPPHANALGAAVAVDGWRVHRAGLQDELSQLAEAVVRARDSERATGEAVLAVLAGAQADLQAVRAARAADAALLATLAGQLEAERIAHAAASEGAPDGVAARLIREELERACHEAAAARAEAAGLRDDLQAERAARARAEEALQQALAVGESQRAGLAAHAAEQVRVAAVAERRPAPESGQLIAALDAAAVSLRATAPPPEPVAVDAGAALQALGYTAQAPAAHTTISPSPWRLAAERVDLSRVVAETLAPRPGLLRALVALAREDTVAAGSLLAGLLPAQGAILDDDISYDLTVRGFGTFAVTVRDGTARVQRIARRRPRREAAFHLSGEPLVLAELLAGEQTRIRRFGRHGVKVNGRRKRVRALAPLPRASLTLAEAVKAGARLEPSLVYRALPFAVAPEWTRGHVFTVAQEIVEFGPRAWYVTARDGVPLDVVEHVAGAAADATVTMTRAAFERLLRGEPAAEGELPVVRGDRHAVAALKRWTELAASAD